MRRYRLQNDFNQGQPIDLGPYSAVLSTALSMGFSTTDALEAALVCGTTDDVELICDYLSLSWEEKKRQYSQAEEKVYYDELKIMTNELINELKIQNKYHSLQISLDSSSGIESKGKSVYFYVDRREIVGAYIHHIIHNEMPHHIIPHCIYQVISSYYTPGDLSCEHLARSLGIIPHHNLKQLFWTGFKYCDCVIVCVKYVDINAGRLCVCRGWEAIESHVENAVVFVYNENSANFYQMLEDYEQAHKVKDIVSDRSLGENQYEISYPTSKYVMKQNTARVYGQKLERQYSQALSPFDEEAIAKKRRLNQELIQFANLQRKLFAAAEVKNVITPFDVYMDHTIGTMMETTFMWNDIEYEYHDSSKIEPKDKSVFFYVDRREIVDAYICVIIHNEMAHHIIPHEICEMISSHYTPGDLLFEHLADFFRTLPPKSKKIIWEHAVKIKTADGRKIVCEQTKDKEEIIRLLCDCVNIYVKDLDGDRDKMSTKKVRPCVENIAVFIHNEYRSLYRDDFENDKMYFADILMDYVQTHIVYRNRTTAERTKI